MGNNYTDWRIWFRHFLIWEWVVHIMVLLIVLILTASRFDKTEIQTLIIMAAATALTGAVGYTQMTRCMVHPRRYFRRIRWWMTRLILGEYLGYMVMLAMVLWLASGRFGLGEFYTLALAAVANGWMSWRGWRSFQGVIADPDALDIAPKTQQRMTR